MALSTHGLSLAAAQGLLAAQGLRLAQGFFAAHGCLAPQPPLPAQGCLAAQGFFATQGLAACVLRVRGPHGAQAAKSTAGAADSAADSAPAETNARTGLRKLKAGICMRRTFQKRMFESIDRHAGLWAGWAQGVFGVGLCSRSLNDRLTAAMGNASKNGPLFACGDHSDYNEQPAKGHERQ